MIPKLGTGITFGEVYHCAIFGCPSLKASNIVGLGVKIYAPPPPPPDHTKPNTIKVKDGTYSLENSCSMHIEILTFKNSTFGRYFQL